MPTAEEGVPFRWNLITPDQLGSLLRGTTAPDLWFLDDLVACAGRYWLGAETVTGFRR